MRTEISKDGMKNLWKVMDYVVEENSRSIIFPNMLPRDIAEAFARHKNIKIYFFHRDPRTIIYEYNKND